MASILVVFVGLLVRILIPILVMVALIYFLRRLDAGWQLEARDAQQLAELDQAQSHLLDLKNCSIKGLSGLQAPESNQPCWQVFRQKNGCLQEECLHCEVFRAAPVLLPG